MVRALVIGANGQDGSFLVKHLIKKGYHVMGIGRQAESRLDVNSPLYKYRQGDLRHVDTLAQTLNAFDPAFIFHVAAVHASAGGSYETFFNDMLQVNVGTVHTILEYLRKKPDSCFIYASSAKVFGDPLPDIINEDSPRKNECLYSISKNTAYHSINYYRKKFGIKASIVYLFNHESELRADSFFIPTVLNCLHSALHDANHVTQINTLDFYCDWGSADEFMGIMVEMLESAPSEDFVLASGICTYARDLISNLFSNYGLDYKRHLKERPRTAPFREGPYRVDLSKLEKHLHVVPLIEIYEVCMQILAKKYRV